MFHALDVLNSTLVSSIRGWRGTSSTKESLQPEQALILFDREGDAECRLVREALTALNLDVVVMPCPLGGRNIKQLKQDSGSDQVPVLFDANVDERRAGAEEIIQYLYAQYKGANPPEKARVSEQALRLSKISTLLRLKAGVNAKPSKPAKEPLRLYSFESSPFSRLVREVLCELELPYELINLGKQQRADMGPAVQRFHLGPYQPVPNSKRERFLQEHGQVQVPFLEDPNTGSSLFESRAIVTYLKHHYAK